MAKAKTLCGVYRISHDVSGHYYYGSSTDCARRKRAHLRSLKKGTHHSVYLQRVVNKYGSDGLRFTFIMRCANQDEAFAAEEVFIKQHIEDRKCCNVSYAAGGGDNLTFNPRRKEIIRKMTKSVRTLMANMTPEERRAKFGQPGKKNGMWGRSHDIITKMAISEMNRGKQYALGRKSTPEQRANMSAAAKKRESAPGYVNGFKGKQHSLESKAAMSAKASEWYAAGNKPSNTLKVKIGKKVYASATDAAKAVGCAVASIGNRCRNPRFPDYSYVD